MITIGFGMGLSVRIFGTFGAKNDALGMVITRGCGCDGTGTR